MNSLPGRSARQWTQRPCGARWRAQHGPWGIASEKIVWLYVTLALAILAVVGYFKLRDMFPSDSMVRSNFEEAITCAELAAWARELIQGEPPGIVDPRRLPTVIRRLVPEVAVVQYGHVEKHVRLDLGGGFYHYAILIGRPGFVPYQDEGYIWVQWADGIWACYEK